VAATLRADVMTPEQLQEEVSRAYVHAVAAQCGYSVGHWTQDHDCIDATISAPSTVGKGPKAKPKVDLQIKATTQQRLDHGSYVSWQLERAHYDRMRAESALPHILVVLLLPERISDRVEHTVDHLLIRRCAYWVKMTGMPAINAESKVVHIPKSQPFSPTELHRIMQAISEDCF
jgi:hypothetical protein